MGASPPLSSEMEANSDPGFSCPILPWKFLLLLRTPWGGKMSSVDHSHVSPQIRDPRDEESPPDFLRGQNGALTSPGGNSTGS